MRHQWNATVLSVTEHKRKKHVSGVGPDAVMEEVSDGWYVRISESSAIGVGATRPDLQPGDTVLLTMEKVEYRTAMDPTARHTYDPSKTVTARTRDRR